MKRLILFLIVLLSFERAHSQNDTMVFNYSDVGNDTIYFITYYSELIIRQDSTYTYTYFFQGYDNFENGKYRIRGKELKLYPHNSETGRTFLITSVKKEGEYIYKSKSNSFLGYNFCLEGKELNLDATNGTHIGIKPKNGINVRFWFKSQGEEKTFIRWFTDKEDQEYAKKMKIVLGNYFGQDASSQKTTVIRIVEHHVGGCTWRVPNNPYKSVLDTSFQINDLIEIPNVIFCNSKSCPEGIEATSYDSLAILALFIKKHPEYVFQIESQTDQHGSEKANEAFTQAGADLIKSILVQKNGVDSTKLLSKGYGESMPINTQEEIDKTKTQEEKEKLYQSNRRTVLRIISKN